MLVTETRVRPSRRTVAWHVLARWPIALGGCLLLTLSRWVACNPDPAPYGNAWTEDHSGYCSHSARHALTVGPGSRSLFAFVLLAMTVFWPATVLGVGTLVALGRRDRRPARRVWQLAGYGSLLVVAFFVVWGHMTIVGGAGG